MSRRILLLSFGGFLFVTLVLIFSRSGAQDSSRANGSSIAKLEEGSIELESKLLLEIRCTRTPKSGNLFEDTNERLLEQDRVLRHGFKAMGELKDKFRRERIKANLLKELVKDKTLAETVANRLGDSAAFSEWAANMEADEASLARIYTIDLLRTHFETHGDEKPILSSISKISEELLRSGGELKGRSHDLKDLVEAWVVVKIEMGKIWKSPGELKNALRELRLSTKIFTEHPEGTFDHQVSATIRDAIWYAYQHKIHASLARDMFQALEAEEDI